MLLLCSSWNTLLKLLQAGRDIWAVLREKKLGGPLMKKSFAAPLLATVPALVRINWSRTCACTVALLALGCTNTQVRWDATRMRQEVMVYYNDQIMDNLIRAKNKLPFVHVDITLLTSQGGSQISGTIGAGETRTNTNTSNSMAGMLGTIANVVMRPFAYR